MTSQRWRQIEQLYHSAREKGEEALAGADPEVRQEVERLLAQDSESGEKLLDQNAGDLLEADADAQVPPGTELGHYRIEELLGRGGMGYVYRATDIRLGRPVAIKICKRAFLDRFRQESRSIAAISHPNVCTLHDVGPNFLVMELVDGETMAARLKRGKLTLAQTLRFGSQIAAALATAHARGIVHRDLKPANIMLAKSGVKVLDFGIARSPGDPTLTQPGRIVGTPAYMAPERADGHEADERADIYALGLILAEMATGRFSRYPADLPPQLDRVIRRCLETDPDERWQSARDLQWELESIAQAPATVTPRSALPAWSLALAALAMIALAMVVFVRLSRHPAPPEMRLSILLPEKSRLLSMAVAPNGRSIAMVLVRGGQQQIWVRALDSLDMAPLAGTDSASDPFWSPDSRFIAFFADAKLKKVEATGGPVQTLCDALAASGGAWNRKGDILIGTLRRVQRVSDSGGPLTDLPGHQKFSTEYYPTFLPDGVHYLATRDSGIWLDSIDGAEEKRILPDSSNLTALLTQPGASDGAVLFMRADRLMALPFDLRRLEPIGDRVTVVDPVARSSYWHVVAASGGVLAYATGKGRDWQYVWRDRSGKVLGYAGDGGAVAMISPDGKRVVGDHWTGGMWVLNLATGVSTPATLEAGGGENPIWSPDGKSLAYTARYGIGSKAANGVGAEQVLLRSQSDWPAFPKSWSYDGRYILYAQIQGGTQADLFAVPLQGDRKPIPIANSPANEDQGQFSPDGRWVAYTSNESGQSEIYVVPFPPNPNAGRWIVSRGGGVQARWRRDGRELFYISPDWTMMAVPVRASGSVFEAGTPQPLFDSEMVDTGIRTGPISWDISPDGNRFLIVTDKTQETPSLNVIVNWRPEPR